MRKIAMVVAAAAALVGAAGVPAVADQDPMNTPNAQAAARVSSAGELLSDKNIVKSWKADTGKYCVTVADWIDTGKTMAVANTVSGNNTNAWTRPTSVCGNAEHTVTVYVTKTSTDEYRDSAFQLAVL
ncbi:hypothetical protein [Streptomyces cavernicola]|uniref:Secreted protein n=1 Tax=Streptomyces cavernicola TaxID=3043613 RepID=A0ABT6SLX7_9ACTN|nr:hypothetical protein [Streptomyces sp. B-S-A6]MDI3408849.1 hypothetical protein [Streptomyces sp. B-S-A6]